MTAREFTWYWMQSKLEYDMEAPEELKRVYQDMSFEDFRSICYNSFCFWGEDVLSADAGVEVHKLLRMTQEFQYHHKFYDEWGSPFVAGGETDYYMCLVEKKDRWLELEDEGGLDHRAEFTPTLNPITWLDVVETEGLFDGVTQLMSKTREAAAQSGEIKPREYDLFERSKKIETYGVRSASLKSKSKKFFADEYLSGDKNFVMFNNTCYMSFKNYVRDLKLFKVLMVKAETVPDSTQIDSRSIQLK